MKFFVRLRKYSERLKRSKQSERQNKFGLSICQDSLRFCFNSAASRKHSCASLVRPSLFRM